MISRIRSLPAALASPAHRAPCRRPAAHAGFSLVEVLVAAFVLVIALLANAGTVGSGQTNQQVVAERRMAHEVFRRFIERLRDAAAEDTAGTLYLRLKATHIAFLSECTTERADPSRQDIGIDPGLRIARDLDAAGLHPVRPNAQVPAASEGDHYGWIAPNPLAGATDPYEAFDIPASLGEVGFLVEVPCAGTTGDPTLRLREAYVAARYGMNVDYTGDNVPDGLDLNGDGDASDEVETANSYRVIPCIVRMRWERRGRSPEELVMPLWLRRPPGGS